MEAPSGRPPTRFRHVRTVVLAALGGIVLTTSIAGCTHGNDYYQRDPYINGRKIDRGLANAEQEITTLLASGDTQRVLAERTAPPFRSRMQHFIRGYARHPTAIARTSPGNDATADEVLVVTCRTGNVQHVRLTWAWFNGAWRAWLDYALTAAGKTVEYPGCP